MILVCISDTHLKHDFQVPDGDVLIHAGDLTGRGDKLELSRAIDWLDALPHKHKVVIAGNHDHYLENSYPYHKNLFPDSVTYLQDSGVEINGFYFYGSPWQPEFGNWAFNLPRGPRLQEKWDQIPDETDVLITHGPPYGILDKTLGGLDVGCEDLREAVIRVQPLLHVFGHIHEGYGVYEYHGTTFYNASVLNRRYELVNQPLVFTLGD